MAKEPEIKFNEIEEQLGSFTEESAEAKSAPNRDDAFLAKITERDEQIRALKAQTDSHDKVLDTQRVLLIGVIIVFFAAFFTTSVALFIHFFDTTNHFEDGMASKQVKIDELTERINVLESGNNSPVVMARQKKIMPHYFLSIPALCSAPVFEGDTLTTMAVIDSFRLEKDGDIHLILKDSGCSLIAEIQPGYSRLRGAFPATSHWKRLNKRLTITGLRHRDREHGQKGAASNGVEIHPVLNIE